MGASPDLTRGWFELPGPMALQWAGVLAGPVAWAFDLMLSYGLVQWTCGGGPPAVLRIITLLSLAIVGAGAGAAWYVLRQVPPGTPADGSQPSHRGHFMGALGLLMCGLFALVVVAGAVPRWVLDACHS